jgi:hypothetical protein
MTKILYIPEGKFITFYHNSPKETIFFEKVNVDKQYKNNIELYIKDMLNAINNNNHGHIWGFEKNINVLRSELEIIYD